METFPFFTQRLVLRAFRTEDAEAFSAYRSDPLVARYQGWDAPYPLEHAQEFAAEMQAKQPGAPDEWYQVALERRAEPGLIGDLAFQVQAGEVPQARMGFTLARTHQGQGYAAEAAARLLAYLFEMLNIHRISAVCDVENTSSARLLERLGMRREAHFIENIWFKGAWGSEYLYALLAEEWFQARAG